MPKNNEKHSTTSFIVDKFNIPKNKEEHILRLIQSTKRCITKERNSLDELFTEQAKRLAKELEALRKKK